MPTITFRRASNVQNIPITDGQIIFDTARNVILMDNGNVRNQYAGATQLISTTPEARSDNAFNAQATTQLFLQKTTVVDTKSNALAVTQNYVPLGCLAFKQTIGLSDYTQRVGNTISESLVSLRGETLQSVLILGQTEITLTSSILSENSYIDIYTGSYTVIPKNAVANISNKTITLYFDPQEVNVNIRVIVKNLKEN
jgi:hypothetical protein